MKLRSLFIIAVMLIAVNPVSAGVLSEVEIGAGLNYGHLCYEDPLELWDAGWAMGFTGGAFFEIPLSKKITFVPGLRFSSLKNKVKLGGDGFDGEFSVKHNYISMPMLIRIEPGENMLFIDAGPEFSLFLSSELQSDYTDALDNKHDDTEDISDDVESFNVGACIRVGFRMYRWDIPVAVTASYHHGFMGVAKEEWLSDWKTREFTFSVSYLFDLTD